MSRSWAIQEICGATGTPDSSSNCSTVSKVASTEEPPAPKVTDKYRGLNLESFCQVDSSNSF